jgi:glucosamine 6-phosphate synthetase-like amidotransferase/phosphosugar isomerase protein
MHSEGILSGELKHGPLAMIDKDMPCIMLIMKDNTYKVCHTEDVHICNQEIGYGSLTEIRSSVRFMFLTKV